VAFCTVIKMLPAPADLNPPFNAMQAAAEAYGKCNIQE